MTGIELPYALYIGQLRIMPDIHLNNDAIIRIRVEDNPKQPGSKAWNHFEILKQFDGRRVGEFMLAADEARWTRPEEVYDYAWGRLELRYCLDQGYIDLETSPDAGPAVIDSVGTEEEIDYGTSFSLERDMQAAIRQDIQKLEQGLTIIDGGSEATVSSGRIDILARDSQNRIVVIELKAGGANLRSIGQILSCIGALQAENPGTQIRGLLVAANFEPRVKSAVLASPLLELRQYRINFIFDAVE